MSSWERLQEPSGHDGATRLSVYANAKGRFHKGARLRWFDDVDELAVYGDPETGRLAFEPAPDAGHAQSISEDGGVHLARALGDLLDADLEAIDGTLHAECYEDEATGYVVADVSHFPGVQADDNGDADGDALPPSAGPETVTCPVCGDEFDSERGKNIHAARMHEDDDDGDGEADAQAAAEGNGGLVTEQVLEEYDDPLDVAAEVDGCMTYHEVGRELFAGNRDIAIAFVEELGLEETLKTGRDELTTGQVRDAIEGVGA